MIFKEVYNWGRLCVLWYMFSVFIFLATGFYYKSLYAREIYTYLLFYIETELEKCDGNMLKT